MSDVVVLSAVRTPIGAFLGCFASVSAPRLGAAAIRSAVARAGLKPSDVSHSLMGCVLQTGLGQAPARQAAIYAGLPVSVRTVTINKVCGSGLQAVIDASHTLADHTSSVVVAGGMEHMSGVPYVMPLARQGFRLGHQTAVDALINDGLWDPYSNSHMGSCAEKCAEAYGFSRAAQEAYARTSFQRAIEAQKSERLADEVAAVEVTGPKGTTTVVEIDEGPGRARLEKMSTLKPVFEATGTITAATSSPLSDGAAALVLCREETARALGKRAVARIVAFGAQAHEPEWFTTAPVKAAQEALKRAGWMERDVDLWEVNEAFAVVPMAFMREFNVPPDRVNVRGGAIALGHPLGCSGARILVTLIAALHAQGLRRGVAAICIGGGEGLAACVEVMA